MKKSTLFSGLVKLTAGFGLLALAGGCSAAAEDVAVAGDEEVKSYTQTLTLDVPDTTAEVDAPPGVYFVDVTAQGKGCKAGTWSVQLADDRKAFTLTFSEYQANVSEGVGVDNSNCQIGVTLHVPQGFSYSVAEFFYSGEVYLDSPGMRAEQSANYYFQGNPLRKRSVKSELKGPTNVDPDDDTARVQEYVFQDTVGIGDAVFSPCGVDRNLQIRSSINVRNNESKTGTGYINTIAADGNVELKFNLKWFRCKKAN